jgi:hypothetical protein
LAEIVLDVALRDLAVAEELARISTKSTLAVASLHACLLASLRV